MRIFIRLAAFAAVFAASQLHAAVYRCQLDDGHILYQQFPCHHDSQPLRLQRRPSGWSALRPGEKALLKSYEKRDSAGGRRPAAGADDASKQAQSCWKRRRQLEALRTQLRRGYALGDSDRLHRRRADHKDYLRRFCSRG